MEKSVKSIAVGTPVEHFTLNDQFGNPVSTESYKGKKLLFSFHPLAWTGICTQQMQALDAIYDELESLGVVSFGMSVDASPTKKAWAESMQLKRLPLLADFWPHGAIAEKMVIFIQKNGTSGRGNILVGEDGLIEWVKIYQLSVMPDFNEVLEYLRSGKTS